MSAGVILFITSAAAYPSMRSAPTLKIWMTPFSSVAMQEKFALLKMASCNAKVLRSVCWLPESMPGSRRRGAPPAVTVAEALFCESTMLQPRLAQLDRRMIRRLYRAVAQHTVRQRTQAVPDQALTGWSMG